MKELIIPKRTETACLSCFIRLEVPWYDSDEVEDKIKRVSINMSLKGNCWGNAVTENFSVR